MCLPNLKQVLLEALHFLLQTQNKNYLITSIIFCTYYMPNLTLAVAKRHVVLLYTYSLLNASYAKYTLLPAFSVRQL